MKEKGVSFYLFLNLGIIKLNVKKEKKILFTVKEKKIFANIPE